jgi:trk system potassium uptake protein TrkA
VFLKKGLNIPRVIARAVSDIHKDILKLVGADRVIQPEKEIAVRVADGISASFTDLVRVNKQFSIIQLVASKAIVGKTIEQLDFLSAYNVLCIGIKDNKDVISTLKSSYIVKQNDRLIFAGKTLDLNNLAKMQ